MRVTDSMSKHMLTNYLLRNRDELYRIQEQTSSGIKVHRPSDNPAAYDIISRHNQEASHLEQFKKNIDRLEGQLYELDSRLQHANDLLLRASEIIVAGGDGTKNPEDLKALGAQINQIIEGLVGVANACPAGSYLFAGLRQDTPAYQVQRNASGHVTSVTYQGSPETRRIEVAHGEYLPANLVGSDPNGSGGIFQSAENDVFNTLIQARDLLLAGRNLASEDPCTADPLTNTLLVDAHYITGTSVTLSASEALPAGLLPETTYYVIRVSDTEIQLAASMQDARNGIAINFDDPGQGEIKLTRRHLADLQRDEDQLMEMRTRLGAYQERLAVTKSINLARQVDVNNNLESEQAIDVADAIMRLNNKQAAYEASMRVAMSTLQSTLLNYM